MKTLKLIGLGKDWGGGAGLQEKMNSRPITEVCREKLSILYFTDKFKKILFTFKLST